MKKLLPIFFALVAPLFAQTIYPNVQRSSSTPLASTRVPFSDASGRLTDASTFTFASGVLTTTSLIGTGSSAVNVAAGITPATELEVDSTSTSSPRGIMSAQYNTGTDGARFHGRKARGTRASPTTVVTGDNLTRWVGSGYDGSSFLEDASIIFGVEGTVAATRIPTNISFWTGTNAAPSVLTQALILKSDQGATFTPSGTAAVTISVSGAIADSVAQAPLYITNTLNTVQGHAAVTLNKTNASASASFNFSTGGTTQWDVGATDDNNFHLRDTTTNNKIFNVTKAAPANSLNVAASGNVLLGIAAASDGVGKIQLATATTSAGGIAFGTDTAWWRAAAGAVVLDHTVGTNPRFILAEFGASKGQLSTSSGVVTLASTTSANLVLSTNSTAALTLDSSQNETAVGYLKSGGFARVTADVTNATATMANITDLTVAAGRIIAGTHYTGTINIFAVDSVNVDGLSFDLGGGSATFTDLEFGFGAQPTGATLGTVTSTNPTTAITLTVVSTSDAVYTIAFGFTCNASGTFIPRFSQTSHSSGTATVRKNSSITLVASTN